MLFYRLQSCNAQIKMLQKNRILKGSKMPKSQTKLSNMQTVTFKVLVTSHHILVIEICFDKGVKKIDGKCFCKDYNTFLCTPCTVLYQKCFCKDCNILLCTPCHVIHKQMPSLHNHRILQESRMPESHTKLANLQAVIFIMLVTSYNT